MQQQLQQLVVLHLQRIYIRSFVPGAVPNTSSVEVSGEGQHRLCDTDLSCSATERTFKIASWMNLALGSRKHCWTALAKYAACVERNSPMFSASAIFWAISAQLCWRTWDTNHRVSVRPWRHTDASGSVPRDSDPAHDIVVQVVHEMHDLSPEELKSMRPASDATIQSALGLVYLQVHDRLFKKTFLHIGSSAPTLVLHSLLAAGRKSGCSFQRSPCGLWCSEATLWRETKAQPLSPSGL